MEQREHKKRLKCEIYRDIPGYEGYYQASNFGHIRSVRNNKVIAEEKSNAGYMLVSLSVNRIHKMVTVHRLVASAFIPNPNNLRDVNHKDGDKTNNNLENLEWVSHSENIKHAYQRLGKKTNGVSVICVETGQRYDSCKDASNQTGINISSINHAINGMAKSAGGFRWIRG